MYSMDDVYYSMFKILIKDSKQSQWKLAQAVKFDTSCDSPTVPLYLGDRFGGIEVTGWVNKKQGKVIEGGTNKNCEALGNFKIG